MSENPGSTEEALELFLARRAAGESEDPASFAARFPELGPELREALEALVALEGATRGPDAEALPERIGDYRVVREIGRGGMGVVLEAVEERFGRRVALKVIPPELLASPRARERFRREALLASRLDHPGIATVYGAGVDERWPWIAMRFVEGRTLSQLIAAARESHATTVEIPVQGSPRASALALAECIARVARALHTAHEQGVVHRDIKPSNIIVGPDGAPVLVDFGLAITEESDAATLTRTGETAGTPAYFAPELVAGERARPDAQCDVYSLGVTLFECLALRRPFDSPTPAGLYHAILAGSTPNLRSLVQAVPRDLSVVVATAMERDRTRRYRSAAALAADLEAVAAGRPVAARPAPLAGRLARWARREPRQALLAGALALATLVVAGLGGIWLASRDVVHAAAENARLAELEDALAEAFHQLGQLHYELAEVALDRVQQLDPGNREAVVGHIIARQGRRPVAELEGLLAQLPQDMHWRGVLEALVARRDLPPEAKSGDFSGASAFDLCMLGVCLQVDATRVPFFDRGERNRLSLHCFTEAILRSHSARPLYYEERAFMAERVRDSAVAHSAAQALLELWPDSPRALYAAGHALSVEDPRLAIPLLERSVALAPRDVEAYNMLAVAYCNAGDAEAAEACAWRALAFAPDSANMLYWLGNAQTRESCIDDARGALTRAVGIDPGLSQAWSQYGLIQLLTGDPAGACPYYARALELEPNDDRARMFYAAALDLSGEPELARAHFEHALAQSFPDVPANWRTLAGVFFAIQTPQECVLAAEAGLALAPNDAQLLGLCKAGREKLDAGR